MQIFTYIAGAKHYPLAIDLMRKAIAAGETIALVMQRKPDNPHDDQAILIFWERKGLRLPVGYLPRRNLDLFRDALPVGMEGEMDLLEWLTSRGYALRSEIYRNLEQYHLRLVEFYPLQATPRVALSKPTDEFDERPVPEGWG